MKKVFISGCYDILHGGHIQFFKEARALGNHLTVCFASDQVLESRDGFVASADCNRAIEPYITIR